MLSRAFSSNALAACAMTAEVPARVVRMGEPGFSGRGGGARSGSELSHLGRRNRVSDGISEQCGWPCFGGETYMGMCNLESIEKECAWRTSSRSLELSLSLDDIGYDGGVQVWRNEVRNGGPKPGWMGPGLGNGVAEIAEIAGRCCDPARVYNSS